MTKAKEAGGSCATDILEIEDNLDAIAKQDSLSAHSIRALAVLALIWINKLGMRLGGRRVKQPNSRLAAFEPGICDRCRQRCNPRPSG